MKYEIGQEVYVRGKVEEEYGSGLQVRLCNGSPIYLSHTQVSPIPEPTPPPPSDWRERWEERDRGGDLVLGVWEQNGAAVAYKYRSPDGNMYVGYDDDLIPRGAKKRGKPQ